MELTSYVNIAIIDSIIMKNNRHQPLKLLGAAFLLLSTKTAFCHDYPEYMGQYSNIEKSQASSDCNGAKINIWSIGNHVIGTFMLADGSCDSLELPIYNATLEKGKFHFESPGSSESIKGNFIFDGSIEKNAILGRLFQRHANGDLTEISNVTLPKKK